MEDPIVSEDVFQTPGDALKPEEEERDDRWIILLLLLLFAVLIW